MPVSTSPVASVLRSAAAVLFAAAVGVGLTACGGGGNPAPAASVGQSTAASQSAAANPAAAAPPAMVGVTTGGALVTLNPSTGVVERTLVSSGVVGDEVSVAPSGLVFFAVQNGCSSTIEEVPAGGGSIAVIAPGSLPAVSPDGAKLAYASEPSQAPQCVSQGTGLSSSYTLEIRTLSSGATAHLPMLNGCQCGGVPEPISHLSWSADNIHLAVSIAAGEDNEGWVVSLLDTTQAQASSDGQWLLYLAGSDLYVSQGGATPKQLTSGLIAAGWG